MKKLTLLASALLFAGCATSSLQTVWEWHTSKLAQHNEPFVVTAVRGAWYFPTGEGSNFNASCIDGWEMKAVAAYMQTATAFSQSLDAAKSQAVATCEEAENIVARSDAITFCKVVFVNEEDVCSTEAPRSVARAKAHQANQQRVIVDQAMTQRQDQCKAFGFTDDTPEMANCLLELYKIANQPQQNTVITNSAPARANSSDTTSGIELMNRGLQILNGVGNQSAPTTTTSRCRRMGDTSGQVYTFSRIGCPVGYAPAL